MLLQYSMSKNKRLTGVHSLFGWPLLDNLIFGDQKDQTDLLQPPYGMYGVKVEPQIRKRKSQTANSTMCANSGRSQHPSAN